MPEVSFASMDKLKTPLIFDEDNYLATSKWTTAYVRFPDAVYTSSGFSVTASKRWLSSCLETHANCRVYKSAIQPTRLLRIDDDDDVYVRLCLTEDIGEVDYCILSYLWGAAIPNHLTMSTVAEFMAGRPAREFPKTLQDAFKVLLALGYRYIWIDSMCILQDRQEDWMHECEGLLDYYRNSSFTIAASSSSSSTEGFFRDFTEPQTFTFTGTSKFDSNAYHEIKLRTSSPFEHDGNPLFSRAWPFQELVLSPRVLSFESDSITWCCNTSINRDTSHNVAPFWKLVQSIRDHLVTENTEKGKTSSNRMRELWEKVVEHFSALGVSNAGDRLIALSGIAKEFQRRTGWNYAAGLWKEDLVQGLLWYCEQPGRSTMQGRYTAPSWSWASVMAQASFDLPWSTSTQESLQVEILITVLEVILRDTDHREEFGEVSSGQLKASALCLDMESFKKIFGEMGHWQLDSSEAETPDKELLFIACLKARMDGMEAWAGLAVKRTTSYEGEASVGIYRAEPARKKIFTLESVPPATPRLEVRNTTEIQLAIYRRVGRATVSWRAPDEDDRGQEKMESPETFILV